MIRRLVRHSLKARVLVTIAGSMACLAALIMLVLHTVAHYEMDRLVRLQVRKTGASLGMLLRVHKVAMMDQCKLLAGQPGLRATIRRGDPAAVAASARDVMSQIHADATMFTDQSGRVLGAANRWNERSAAHSDPNADSLGIQSAEGVHEVLEGRPWIGTVIRFRRILVQVSVPFITGGRVHGAFTAFYAVTPHDALGYGSGAGTQIAYTQGERVLLSSCAMPPTLTIPRNTPTELEIDGRRFFGIYEALPDTSRSEDLGMVTLVPYDEAAGLFMRTRAIFLAAMLGGLLLALLFGAVAVNGVVLPLESVAAAARTLQAGKWPERLESSRQDEIGLLQSVFNDMADSLRVSQERLLAMIDRDPLTELDNHRRFQERLQLAALRCEEEAAPLSLLLVDLDHFQEMNHTCGHQAGDEILRRAASVIRDALPMGGSAARFGGDEFAIILPGHTVEDAERIGESLRASLSLIPGTESTGGLQASLGCAELGLHSGEPEGLVLAAELAVERAKQLGRNRLCRFDSVPTGDSGTDPAQLYRFLKDGSLAMIQALAAAVDAKDPYTQGHSQRVARYAADLARHIGWDESEIDAVFTTGTLHDVGKIGVPDAVLQKPGRLEPDERAVMETHPILGEVIIRKVPQLAHILPGVRHHHERWDGRGYPDGLSGEGIPLLARILAVADTFDAMTSDRPYRRGLEWNRALGEIAGNAGTQFDPVLARAFVEMMQAGVDMPLAA